MHTQDLRITQLIHDNCAIILTFAFSQPSLAKLRAERFEGEWKYLDRICFSVSRTRAERAALELAVHLRVLDDEQGLSSNVWHKSKETLGKLHKADGGIGDLSFRDLTNKIMHSTSFDWDFSKPDDPVLVCYPVESDRWLKAEINIVSLAALCGDLMS